MRQKKYYLILFLLALLIVIASPLTVARAELIQGITYYNCFGPKGLITNVNDGFNFVTTRPSKYDYKFLGVPPGAPRTISVNVPPGYTNPEYNYCRQLGSLPYITPGPEDPLPYCPHSPQLPWQSGSSASLMVNPGENIDLWWRFAPNPNTGDIQGITYNKNDRTIGVNANVSISGGPSRTTSLPLYDYYYLNLPACASRTVSVNIPAGYSGAEHSICINDVGLCHTEASFISGNSVIVNIQPGKYIDLWWRFIPSGTPSPTPPPPTRLPPPQLDIIGPKDDVILNNAVDPITGYMQVPLSWSFNDPLNGNQTKYKIELSDLDADYSATRKCSYSITTSFSDTCLNKVEDFKKTGGSDPWNDRYIPGSDNSRTVWLRTGRHYIWRVRAVSSVSDPYYGTRVGRSQPKTFQVGSGLSTPTPTPTPTPSLGTPSVDLKVNGLDPTQANPLVQQSGSTVNFSWTSQDILDCIAERSYPPGSDDSERTKNWWDADGDGNGGTLLAAAGSINNFVLPTLVPGDAPRLLEYKISCTSDGNAYVINDKVYIQAMNQPVAILSASPTSIREGESSTLNWRCENSTQMRIDSDHGENVMSQGCEGNCNGQKNVYPNTQTRYTLTCSAGVGDNSVSVQASVNIQVIRICEGPVPCE